LHQWNKRQRCSNWKHCHLKLVGRGNYTDFMEKDIRNLKTALEILENTDTEAAFRTEMKKQIFPYGCSGNCYYL